MDMIAERDPRARARRLAGDDGRRARQPHAGDRQPRRRDARQRGELPDQEAAAALGIVQVENQARI
jgi:hypothetical protein